MLSEKSRPVIEQTIGVIAERIPAITPEFYKSMFNARPDLLDGMFSRSNQKNGTQPQALAGSIAAFASHLLKNPDSYPDEVLSRVAHKHTSLGLLPDEYPTVHEHLFGAIAADLGDAATPEVVAAWDEVYWLMADALIKLEKGLYGQQANDVMFAPFKLISKENIAKDVIAFEFEPADDTPLTRPIPGQYVTIQVKVKDGIRQPRQFTLVPCQEGHRRVVVRKDPQGEVTPILHEDINEGDILEISNPYGDVVLDEGHGALVLASAGIGTTPIVSFLDRLAKEGSQRKVTVLHADHSLDRWPGRQIMERLVDSLPNAQMITWLETPGEGDHEGFMDLSEVDLDLDQDTTAFMCGPLPFMKGLRSQLIDKGVPGRNIHYEIFGPDQWMLHDEARKANV
ncbi:hemin transporter [Kocuria sp. cx-455]|uniref:globin domain-containing protein n=1 Tax=unclassified Candidatus Sulfotelmatobacter TaxID=2635724 RepID=UPI001685B7CC|nr:MULTISPECIES: globin domain-containing protein [unclassified Candidatus Sulfotelmatobacter]MBD2761715.1 hemin transporter [Kocuria sp. cx-116]MBD2764012.1 hemin transporter [Kocuria sp. cx-455]